MLTLAVGCVRLRRPRSGRFLSAARLWLDLRMFQTDVDKCYFCKEQDTSSSPALSPWTSSSAISMAGHWPVTSGAHV